MTATVQVNECRINATTRGAIWWHDYRRRFEAAGRITTQQVSIGGDLVLIACDSRDDAAWLLSHMISRGIPESAVRITKPKGGKK